jgi:hypothetical protein
MKVVLNEIDYNIKPLTIEQYLALKDNKEINEVEIIAMMTGAPVQLIKQAPMAEVKFVSKMLMSELASSEDLSPLVLDLEFKGVEYGLIKPSRMSYEEWINMEVFMAQKPVNLLKLATHLYRPLKSKKYGEDRELVPYNLDECTQREEEFKSFPVNICMSALFFLTTFAKTLTEDFLSSTLNKKSRTNDNLSNLLPKKK